MVRIRSDILYKQKINEVKKSQKQAKRFHISQPVLNNNLDDEDNNESDSICEDYLNISD
jgi:hypothetical protein